MGLAGITISNLISGATEAVSTLIEKVVSPLDYYSEAARRAEIAKYTPENLVALIREDQQSILIASDPAGPVGFCISRFDDGLLWLAWIGVAASHRHTGLAMELLRALEASARTRGAHKLWCDCRTTNAASKALLERFGFRIICTVKNHWYGHDYHLWEKLI